MPELLSLAQTLSMAIGCLVLFCIGGFVLAFCCLVVEFYFKLRMHCNEELAQYQADLKAHYGLRQDEFEKAYREFWTEKNQIGKGDQ